MGAQPRILVVDDSPQIREFYRLLLRKMGCVPVAAGSGEEALKCIANAPAPFALIVLDLLMPGKTGWETLMQIRDTDGYSDIPVVVITGMDLPEDQVARLRDYCQKVLMKSEFSLLKIKDMVQEFLPEVANE